jgi:membrane protein DedA with SNARE-associated domain
VSNLFSCVPGYAASPRKGDVYLSKALIFHYIAAHGYITIWTIYCFEFLGLPIPGETIMAYAGYLVYLGKLSWVLSILAVSLGVMAGITISYYVGSKVGSPLIHKYGRYINIDVARFDKASNWFDIHGNKILIVAVFVPGLRNILGYIAGILQMPYRIFAPNAYLGALLYATVFVSLGKYLGPDWEKIFALFKNHINLAAAGLILLTVIYLVWKYKRQAAS